SSAAAGRGVRRSCDTVKDAKTLLTTKDAKGAKVGKRRTLSCFVFFVTFVVVFLRRLDPTLAQTEVTEAALAAASGGRVLRIGSTVDGHVTLIPLEAYVSR